MGYPPPSDPQPIYTPPMAQYGAVPQRPTGAAIALEAILAFFGIYGVGWLMSGNTRTGALIMIAGFVWDLVAGGTIFFTLGAGALCVGPLHLAFIAASTIALANQRKPQ